MCMNVGDAEIVKFLTEEIATERKNQKVLPSLSGWEVKTEGAEVTMTRPGPAGEKIIVTLNINHTVDSAEPDDGQGEVRRRDLSALAFNLFKKRT